MLHAILQCRTGDRRRAPFTADGLKNRPSPQL